MAFKLLSPKDFAALKILIPTEESCTFAIRKIYGNKVIDIITHAPNKFFIGGKAKSYPLKNSDKRLEYSKIPTKINAYTYVGKAIDRLKAQLKKLLPGNL